MRQTSGAGWLSETSTSEYTSPVALRACDSCSVCSDIKFLRGAAGLIEHQVLSGVDLHARVVDVAPNGLERAPGGRAGLAALAVKREREVGPDVRDAGRLRVQQPGALAPAQVPVVRRHAARLDEDVANDGEPAGVVIEVVVPLHLGEEELLRGLDAPVRAERCELDAIDRVVLDALELPHRVGIGAGVDSHASVIVQETRAPVLSTGACSKDQNRSEDSGSAH